MALLKDSFLSILSRTSLIEKLTYINTNYVEPMFKGSSRNGLIYALLFFISLFFFVVAGFNKEPLRRLIINELSAQTGFNVSIKDVGLAFPVGLKLYGLKVSDNKSGIGVRSDYLKAKLSIFSLLTASPKITIQGERGDGSFSLNLQGQKDGKGKVSIEFESNALEIAKVLELGKGIYLPVNGKLNLSGLFEMSDGQIGSSAGNIKFTLNNIDLRGGEFAGGLIKKIGVSKASCQIILEKRRLSTKECRTKTKMGSVELRVSTMLTEPAERTPLAGFVIITNASGLLKTFLQIYPKYQRPDGSYQIPLKGTFSNPSIGI